MSDDRLGDLINQFTTNYTKDGIGTLLEEGATFGTIMILLEQFTLATLMVNVRHFKMKPHVSAGLAEAALQRALDRFAEKMNEEMRR